MVTSRFCTHISLTLQKSYDFSFFFYKISNPGTVFMTLESRGWIWSWFAYPSNVFDCYNFCLKNLLYDLRRVVTLLTFLPTNLTKWHRHRCQSTFQTLIFKFWRWWIESSLFFSWNDQVWAASDMEKMMGCRGIMLWFTHLSLWSHLRWISVGLTRKATANLAL